MTAPGPPAVTRAQARCSMRIRANHPIHHHRQHCSQVAVAVVGSDLTLPVGRRRIGSCKGSSSAPVAVANKTLRSTLHGARLPVTQQFVLLHTATAAPGASAAMTEAAAPEELQDYILKGPLLSTCNLSPTTSDLEQWIVTGRQLALQLGFDHDKLDDTQRLRIYHYYLPIYFWCDAQLAAHKAAAGASSSALVLGISAPQGCGKTTIVEQLELLFAWSGRAAASVSIDDFYLSYADQTALAQRSPGNKLLQYRGNAGTHDLRLGADTVQQLRGLTEPGASMQVPRYDKSAHAGRGDRAPPASWPSVSGPLDIVLFEGWMSGFAPLPDAELSALDKPDLAEVNTFLREYEGAWDSLVDAWLVVRIGDPAWVFKWRLQAEERMRASGKAGMSDEQVADFVDRFMPAYAAYLPRLYAAGPTTARPGHTLIIEVDQDRSPVAVQPRSVV